MVRDPAAAISSSQVVDKSDVPGTDPLGASYLGFLTVLAPSERYYERLGRSHKKLTDWARLMIIQLRRWLAERYLVMVAHSSYSVLTLLHFCQSMSQPVTFITRLRMDAALF